MKRLPVAAQAFCILLLAALAAALAERALQGVWALPDAARGWRWALLQGVLAAGLSCALRQAPWWHAIQLGFVPLALAANLLALPAGFYLAALVIAALTYRGVARTRVPLFLSDEIAWRGVLGVLPTGPFRFVDLGSGLGGVPLWLERRRPDGDYLGVELAPLPWLASWLRARLRGSRVAFRCGDYNRLDLGRFDAAFAFLSPVAMPALWAKAQAEMRVGSVFVSLAFDAPGRAPDATLQLADGERHRLLVWRM